MRMWMVDPKVLCRKHLLGAHVETHMFYGSMKKDISMEGYISRNLLEPRSLQEEHDLAAEELIRRGYKHRSPLVVESNVIKKYPDFKIDKTKSFTDLVTRCKECKKNAENI